MKRLLTFAVVTLISAMAFAQPQHALRRSAYNSVQQAVRTSQADLKAKTEAMSKANAANEYGTTRLARKGSPATVGRKLGLNDKAIPGMKVSKPFTNSLHKAPAKETETVGNVTITKNQYGMITNVTGVDAKYYEREGQALYYSNGSTNLTFQSGMAEIITDGNNVYWHKPVSRYTQDTWIKGTKEGNTMTFPTWQPVSYSPDYETTLSVRWAVVDAGGSIQAADNYADSFTFVIDGDVMRLQGSEEWDQTASCYCMGVLWDDDDTFTGNGDLGTILTLASDYTPASTELVELPEGATTEGWYINGAEVGEYGDTPIINENVNVAFVGDDVYVQGIFSYFPTAWVKGTKRGNEYVFSKFQCLGFYSGTLPIWMVGIDMDENIVDATATYDADSKTLAFNCDLVANAAEDRIYYLTWLMNVTVNAEKVEFVEPVLNALTATLPYLNTFETGDEMAQVAIYDANKDGKTFTFQSDPIDGVDNIAAKYAYSSDNIANDYLVFPSVELEAGKVYSVSIDTRSQSDYYTETVSVLCGKESKASALTTEVIEPTDIINTEYAKLANNAFVVDETGMYSFAVKACSQPDKYFLYVDNFSVKEMNDKVPAAAADLTVTPDANGANKAIVAVTAPAKTIGGADLTSALDMVIKVDGVEAVNSTVQPGAAVSEEITVAAPGFHAISVVFSNEEGSCDAVSEKVYIGVDLPNPPSGYSVVDKSNAVGMSWNAPTAGVNNGVLLPDQLTYNIYPVTFEEVWIWIVPVADTENPYATGITGTSYDVPFNTNEGEMDFTYFGVAAENEAGVSEATLAAVVTGTPYSLPVKESAKGQTLSYFWEGDNDDANSDLDGGVYYGQNPSDGDDVNLQFRGMTEGYVALRSGKIALNGAANPVVKFDAMNILGNSSIEVNVISPAGKDLIKTIVPGDEYETYTYSLLDYKDADWVRVELKSIITGEATGEPIAIIDIDNIQIVNLLDHNLTAMNISVPARVNAGNDIVATATVQNQGKLAVAADDYSVKFTIDGKEFIADGVELAPDANAMFSCTLATNAASAAAYAIKAEVLYDADEDLTDNSTAEMTVKVVQTNYPTPENVEANLIGNSVTLVWDEPNIEAAVPQTITDDFESYEPFQFGNSIGDWTLVDGDGTAMGGIQDTEIPNLTLGSTTGSFFVMNREAINGNDYLAAASGEQYLSTMFAYDAENGSLLDDWLISPALPGIAQTISFFAKSYSGNYPEFFQVLYSTTDMATGSFVKISGDADIIAPDEWTEYSFDLPEGTKYFAIRCVSDDAFMFFIDDVTYTTVGSNADLDLVGYNVYRNGVKINEEPLAETNFTDTNLESQTTYTYGVSAVYIQGESTVSVADVTTGVESINSDDNAIYYNMQGVRVAKPAAGTPVIRVVNGNASKSMAR